MWINSDSCLRRKAILTAEDQTRSYYGKSDKSVSAVRGLKEKKKKKSCRDASAEFLPGPGGNEISEVELWSCDRAQLTERDAIC